MKTLTCILSIMLSTFASAQSWNGFEILGLFMDNENYEVALLVQESNSFFVETFSETAKKRQKISISKEEVIRFLNRNYGRMTNSEKRMYEKDPVVWIKPDEIRKGVFVFHFTKNRKIGFDQLGNIYKIE